MWFTENPWPPVMIVAVMAIVFGIVWFTTRRSAHFLGMIGFAFLALAVLVVEEMIVTEAENVESRVLELAKAVSDEDVQNVLSFFSDDAEALKSSIGSHMDDIEVPGELRITDLEATIDTAGSTAQSHFRANGDVTYKQSWTSSVATRWNLTWKKSAGVWKVSQVERLDPIKGDVIGTFSGM